MSSDIPEEENDFQASRVRPSSWSTNQFNQLAYLVQSSDSDSSMEPQQTASPSQNSSKVRKELVVTSHKIVQVFSTVP